MSTPINDGGPAFPCAKEISRKDEVDIDSRTVFYDVPQYQHFPGMTLRDYFAAKALTLTWVVEHKFPLNGREPTYESVAQKAYLMADAMLAERSKKV